MRPTPPSGRIPPKISSMPRQNSEATIQLELYKLVVERQRLDRELDKIEKRRTQIHQRMVILEQQICGLEGQVHHLREFSTTVRRTPASTPLTPPLGAEYETLMLEY